MSEVGERSPSPWKPRTRAMASTLPRYGSSPEPSMMRPHRASRATSTIGAKVQCSPFDRRDACRAVRGGRVERGGLAERYREDGPHPVDDVVAEDERDVQSRLLDGDALHLSRDVGAVEAEEGTDAAGAYVGLTCGIDGGAGLS